MVLLNSAMQYSYQVCVSWIENKFLYLGEAPYYDKCRSTGVLGSLAVVES